MEAKWILQPIPYLGGTGLMNGVWLMKEEGTWLEWYRVCTEYTTSDATAYSIFSTIHSSQPDN